ncbi:Ff.00g065100.m01.CDS01 [Fusarium sp. VM40]|nr:Ff.00g065100.m01.CDS01 [Fusarium sp. VM40]
MISNTNYYTCVLQSTIYQRHLQVPDVGVSREVLRDQSPASGSTLVDKPELLDENSRPAIGAPVCDRALHHERDLVYIDGPVPDLTQDHVVNHGLARNHGDVRALIRGAADGGDLECDLDEVHKLETRPGIAMARSLVEKIVPKKQTIIACGGVQDDYRHGHDHIHKHANEQDQILDGEHRHDLASYSYDYLD